MGAGAPSAAHGSDRGAFPDLIVIGAAKCGTTSLHHQLDLHPQIAMTREKELHFFTGGRRWERGLDWYRAQFDPRAPVRGEASVTYTAFPKHRGVPQRMHDIVPDVRLLYIVRDPIARIVSDYVHRFSDGLEHRPLRDALEVLEGNDLVERSRYHLQLEQYLAVYPQDRLRVVSLERLRADPAGVLRGIYRFLEVDPGFASPRLHDVWNPTAVKRRKGPVARALYRLSRTAPARILSPEMRRRIGLVLYRPFSRPIQRPSLDDITRARLVDFLAPDAARLRALTGESFAGWSV